MKTVISIKENKDASCIMIHQPATEQLKAFLLDSGFSENKNYPKIDLFEINNLLNFSMIKELKNNFQIDSDELSIFFVTEKEEKEYFKKINNSIA